MYTIQHLTPVDEPRIRALLAAFADGFDDRESYLSRQPSAEYLRRMLAGDTAIALYTKLGVREDVMHFDIPVK